MKDALNTLFIGFLEKINFSLLFKIAVEIVLLVLALNTVNALINKVFL